MEIRQIQTFRTVAELNSFTKAAQKLQYSQASVTAHIKQLEDELGYSLFDRLGKHIQLTSMGKELFPFAVELLSIYNKIQDLSSEEHGLKGEVRIGAPETITVYKLSPIISEFRAMYPDVTFSLINDHCNRLKERLHTGELDIAITLEPEMVNDPLLTCHLWSEEQLVFVGGLQESVHSIEEAEGKCFIFSDKDCALRKFFEGKLIEKEINTYSYLEFTSMEAMKQCVVSGLGISLMPLLSVSELLKKKQMKILNSNDQPQLFAQVVYHKNKWLSSASKALIDILLSRKTLN